MKLKFLAAAVLGLCLVVAAALLVTHGPASGPTVQPVVAGPAAPPTIWPDYRGDGFGFPTPATADGELVAHGYRLITRTFAFIGPEVTDPSKRYAGNNLACTNCHLDAGTNRAALPLVGVLRTYPKHSERSGREISLAQRIDECMTRSMNGRALPTESREMQSFLAYLRFIGQPQATPPPPQPAAPPFPPDVTRGAAVYERVCATCHRRDGLGTRWGAAADARGYRFPPVWGPDSFNSGAGMDRFDRSVGFIRHNMPRGVDPEHPQLTLQDAWDVAAMLQNQPRPLYTVR